MEGVRIDGADAIAVRDAVRKAAARARAGDGPQFIEAVTFRARPTPPPTTRAATWTRRSFARPASECLGRLESRLRQHGILDERTIGEIRDEARAEMEAAIEAAEALPEPDPRQIFDTTYALPPRALRRDRGSALEP